MRCPALSELPAPPRDRAGWPWTEESPQLPDTMPDGCPWPRISIVTPSYNQGQFLEETIRSVLLQGYPNLEYIIIDGSSTDGSVEIIKTYEKHLAYWASEPDKGQSHAVNKGFSRATGEMLAWLNADDLYLLGAFAGVAEAFKAHPEAGVIFGRCRKVDQWAEDLGDLWEITSFSLPRQLLGNIIHQAAAFIHKDVLGKVGPIREDLHFAMDFEFWIRVALHFPIIHVPTYWAAFRSHPQQKTYTASAGQVQEMLRIYRELATNDLLRTKPLSQGLRRGLAQWLRMRGILAIREGHRFSGVWDYGWGALYEWEKLFHPRSYLNFLKALRGGVPFEPISPCSRGNSTSRSEP